MKELPILDSSVTTGNIVYRIQNKRGHGPFRFDSAVWEDSYNRHNSYQTEKEEFGVYIWDLVPPGAVGACGFASVDQMMKWFTDNELRRMYDVGFNLVELSVDEILDVSEYQLYFWRQVPLNIGANVVSI